MFRPLFALALLCASQLASAGVAGQVIFVAGQVSADAHRLALGNDVAEGQLLSTGADGYLYVQTADDGLFILRPNTQARIATYQIDRVHPENTHVKLELLHGVARSKSGKAVKLARQNFRFNTPVAAIGVRGTDFTVSTTDDVSRVAVLSGAITMSGFSGSCSPAGTGPCEGASSRELTAAQKAQLLQIQRGQEAAKLVSASTLAPDVVAPPRPDEPGKTAPVDDPTHAVVSPALEPRKAENAQPPGTTTPPPVPGSTPGTLPPPVLVDVPGSGTPTPGTTPPDPVPPPVTPPPDTPPVVVTPPGRQIVWGRYQQVADQPVQVNLVQQLGAGATVVSLRGRYALLLTPGAPYVIPERGSVGFALQDSEAYIYNANTTIAPVRATLENGQLTFDFDKRRFATSFDLVNAADRYNLHAVGAVDTSGRFSVDSDNIYPNTMNVDGVLSSEQGGHAAYVFQGRLNSSQTANGATYWGKK